MALLAFQVLDAADACLPLKLFSASTQVMLFFFRDSVSLAVTDGCAGCTKEARLVPQLLRLGSQVIPTSLAAMLLISWEAMCKDAETPQAQRD